MFMLALAVVSTLSPIEQPKNEPILCVEVGWTRIKAAAIPEKLTFEKLKEIQTTSGPSDQWIDQRFPVLFKNTCESPLKALLDLPHSKISLSVSGPVIDNSIHPDLGGRGIPENLKQACEKEANCEVIVENDAIAWAIGAMEYQKLKSKQLNFPCLIITLGTSVGLSLALNDQKIVGIEQIYINCPYSRLKAQLDGQVIEDDRFICHEALGEMFFDWTDKTDNELVAIYNKRFLAHLEDVSERLEDLFRIKIKEYLVGGGNSRFIEMPKAIVYNPQAMQSEGVSPDMIQLLGCWRMGQSNRPRTKIYPSLELIDKIGDLWDKGKTDAQINFILDLKNKLIREAN